MPKKLNLDEKYARRTAQLARFVQQYARKAPRHGEPNDRSYDVKIEEAVKRMSPEELDRMLNDDER